MRISKYLIVLIVLLTMAVSAEAQTALSLEDCHRLALQSNGNLKISEEKKAETEALKKMALSEFFPKFSANGTYIWNEKTISLLSDEQKDRINNLGTTVLTDLAPSLNPTLLALLSGGNLAQNLNLTGQNIVNAMELDFTNVFAGTVSVLQPVYLGGKLRALYQAASLADQLSGIQYDKEKEDLLISVDAAYWQIISLQHKQQLAQQYCDLLTRLSSDVEAMKDAEVATQGDLTKVRVKLNEAQMSLTKANNGLALSKMLLMQLCGLPMNQDITLVEDTILVSYTPAESINMEEVWQNRSEMRMLDISEGIADAGVKIATSGLLPNIVATGSYVVTNPNSFNGFQTEFDGMFTVGVAVNIPLLHASDFYAVKAAKHKRNEIQYQRDEARSKIELQVNKLNYELEVANKKLAQALSNLENAEENLRLADESFKAGMINSNDLMSAQTAWLSAKSDVIDAEIEIRMSHLYLQQALGR
ncbi:MAG: TolC family protein [Bacteroidales bacterium]|nr:TolC family protein [Bacteroidales bacterium]